MSSLIEAYRKSVAMSTRGAFLLLWRLLMVLRINLVVDVPAGGAL